VAAFTRIANDLAPLHDGIGVRYGFILMLRSRFVHPEAVGESLRHAVSTGVAWVNARRIASLASAKARCQAASYE
jgi:hypothetical protein